MGELLIALALLRPASGLVIQGLHARHTGYDIACLKGSPIVASHDGIATTSWSHQMGNVVTITGERVTTSYSHLQARGYSGAVSQGQQIGACGSTGRSSHGPHLHFEVRARNPERVRA